MGFTKLDEGIIYSSIMGEDDAVFRVWIVLLATCKADGISPVSETFIASITKKDVAEIKRCIDTLMSPDETSRSKNDDGRRIERIDGGFKIINYEKYRASSKTDYLREKQAKYRENLKKRIDNRDTKGIRSASASASASSSDSVLSEDSIKKIKKKKYKIGQPNPEISGSLEPPLPAADVPLHEEFVGVRPAKIFVPPTIEQVKAYCLIRKNGVNPEIWHSFYTSKGWMVGKNKMKDWQAAVRTWERDDGGGFGRLSSGPSSSSPTFNEAADRLRAAEGGK
jgi:hypothetical protein